MSKAQELLPCPFCGGSAHIRPSQDADGCFWSWVQCNQCGARTQGDWVSNRSETCPIFYEGVREEWNRRPASSEQQAAQQDAELVEHVIDAARNAMDASIDVMDDFTIESHLVAALSLALDELDAARASNGGKE